MRSLQRPRIGAKRVRAAEEEERGVGGVCGGVYGRLAIEVEACVASFGADADFFAFGNGAAAAAFEVGGAGLAGFSGFEAFSFVAS